MKITKLPNSIDPNILMKEEIERRNSICPFCGETEKYDLFKYIIENGHIKLRKGIEKQLLHDEWYGNEYKDRHPCIGYLAFWKPNYYWHRNYYKCHTCGAEWKSNPYPEIEI